MSLTLPLDRVPFSFAGSYLAVSRLVEVAWWWYRGPSSLNLRLVDGHHYNGPGLASLHLLEAGVPAPAREDATPERLRLRAPDGGEVEVRFLSPERLLLSGRRAGLRLVAAGGGDYDNLRPAGPKRWRWNASSIGALFDLVLIEGRATVSAPWDGQRSTSLSVDLTPEEDGPGWSAELIELPWRSRSSPPVAALPAWTDWLAAFPAARPRWSRARQLAAYVLWSATVAPRGYLSRPTVYMSKNWMARVWSWDHCFNALALAPAFPDLAWDQFVLPFDHQEKGGRLPDCLTDCSLGQNFTKPPIHGLVLRELLAVPGLVTRARLADFYPRLAAWTRWWLDERDDDADGLPQYDHGNDSGWDNASLFKVGLPVEGPDLASFLILQLDVLADLATRLGKAADARRWRARADRLLADFIAHSWREGRFVAPRSGDHAVQGAGADSLVAFMPLLLGPRLPAELRAALVAGLARPGRFVTRHGVATEAVDSPHYEPDGYWRGPIWAPSTFLIVRGLQACGEPALARRIADRFCQTCAAGGMAENFDARTGAPLRDPAYTWTASVFLLFAAKN